MECIAYFRVLFGNREINNNLRNKLHYCFLIPFRFFLFLKLLVILYLFCVSSLSSASSFPPLSSFSYLPLLLPFSCPPLFIVSFSSPLVLPSSPPLILLSFSSPPPSSTFSSSSHVFKFCFKCLIVIVHISL